jgi:hypothetical protein
MLAINEIETTCERSQGEVHDSSERITETLDQILRSPRFRDSQQLQTLLRYVVEEAVKGNDENLKERLIGIYVFGRRPDYDTAEDPIVRSRMGLLRKRLAQYYEGEAAEQTPVQIVIPNGTYRPAFVSRPITKGKRTQSVFAETKPAAMSIPVITNIVPAMETPPPLAPGLDAPAVALSDSKRKLGFKVASIAAVLAVVLLGAWWFFLRPQQQEMDALWAPILKGKQPVYIYTGTMPVYEPESPADEASSPADLYWPIRVPEPPSEDLPKVGPNQVFSYGEGMLTGSVYADIRVSAFLNNYKRTPVLRSGPNLPYMDLKGSPLILIGSFDNYWTRVMNESLPFYFDRGFGIRERAGTHRRWHNPLKAEMTPRMMDDYALVFRVMDSKAGAPVLAIAGLSTCGTHAVADFVTDPVQMKALSGIPKAALLSKNIELVLHTSLVNCAPTSVQVIASKVW